MKRCVSVLLTGILLLTLLSATVCASTEDLEEKHYGDFTYTVANKEISIVNVSATVSGDVVIPASIEGYPVTSISDTAFDRCKQMVTLKIPSKVEAIGEGAFEECLALTAFIVGFGNKAFCAREGVLYNKDRTTLLCYPPAKENTEFSIPDGVTSVDMVAFEWSSKLERVTVADSVVKLGERAFHGSTALKQITFGTGLTQIGVQAFSGCVALESFPIPNSVTSVGRAAFSNCSALQTVTFGRALTKIDGTMFANCTSLKSVAIPENVKSILSSAFMGCSALETVTLPSRLTSIGAYAFYKCDNLKTVGFTGSDTDKDKLTIGAKNETLDVAEWQYNATPAAPSAGDTSVGPQPIAGPDSNVVRAWVLIGGLAALLTVAIVLLIAVLIKGIKART